jgi:hypothetical protein
MLRSPESRVPAFFSRLNGCGVADVTASVKVEPVTYLLQTQHNAD